MERLQKLIAASGICSRRQAEMLILEGKVRVNGKVAELGQSADLATDTVLVGGRELPKPQTVVYLLNKPKGYVCSLTAQGKQKLVTDLVPNYPRVYPVGRLDKESEGLLLLTNDGALSAELTHPRNEHAKTYQLKTHWQDPEKTRTAEWLIAQLLKGVKLGDGDAKADKADAKVWPDGNISLNIIVHEGRKHLLRRMCATLGLDVSSLKRTKFATLALDRVKPGAWRLLTQTEIERLRAS